MRSNPISATHKLRTMKSILLPLFFAAASLLTPLAIQAQTVTIVGIPANFDTYNDTGAPVYGLEIEADGISASDVTRAFPLGFAPVNGVCVIRYCSGVVTSFPGGVYIRWMSPYDPISHQFTVSTPVWNGAATGGESCWTYGLGAGYPAAGCEHFGISTLRNPTKVTYRWLVPDPLSPGQLTYYTGNVPPQPGVTPVAIPVPIPQPVINLIPAVGGGNPIVQFHIALPPPPPPPMPPPVPQCGDAQWVKVYKLEQNHEADLNDLMGGNPAVPEFPMAAETEWALLQYDPNSHSHHNGLDHKAVLGNGARAVVRRYEHYKYTGAYDPSTHAALCADGLCNAPGKGELGKLIGAQNAGVNIEMPSVTITKFGNGSVNGGPIKCGNVCSGIFIKGTALTLTATAPSNGVFNGWTGDCTGAQASCSVTVNTALSIGATFNQVFTLSASRSGNGVVTATPNGEFSTLINCGNSCSAKFQKFAKVTLTATPSNGAKFTGWSGACSGNATTCSLSITADTKAQASFK